MPPPPQQASVLTYLEAYLPESLSSFLLSSSSSKGSPDIVSIAAFLLAVYLSLRILDYIRRSLISWLVLLFKIALVMAIVQGFFYVRMYGWERTLRDLGWVYGMLEGMGKGLFAKGSEMGWFGRYGYGNGNAGGLGTRRTRNGVGAGRGWNMPMGEQVVMPNRRTGRWT